MCDRMADWRPLKPGIRLFDGDELVTILLLGIEWKPGRMLTWFGLDPRDALAGEPVPRDGW